jgi:hypothetical protein
MKSNPSNPPSLLHDRLVAAVKNRQVVRFMYRGHRREVQPQTYGQTFTGSEALRGYQTGGTSSSGGLPKLNLFTISLITDFELTGEKFEQAQPEHNPKDSAFKKIYATLPRPLLAAVSR